MKRTIWIFLLMLMSSSALALNFFGIEYNGTPANNLVNLIYSLAEGDLEQADRDYEQLKKTDPKLAKSVKIEELKTPCTGCRETGTLQDDTPCPACAGNRRVTDPHALGYLQHKFCSAMEDGKSEKAAWREALAAFKHRRDAVLSAEMLYGSVIRVETNGVLLSISNSTETVYIKGVQLDSNSEGAPISGQVWPAGTHSCPGEGEQPIEIKCYTTTLWID